MSVQQKIVIRIFFIVLVCILSSNITFGETLTYRETTSGKDSIEEMVINKLGNGYLLKSIISTKDEMTYNTDASFSVLKWKYNSPENGTGISAERSGDSIFITGQFKHKKYEEKLKIDNLPWYQDWGLGLRAFITSDNHSTCFWSINPDDLKISKFEAKKKRIEIIEVNGQKVESVYVKISLTGMGRLFWSGDMWFRKSDGTYVYSKMKKGPTAPLTTIQLIKEK